MSVRQLITDSVKQNASDLHLSAGHLPVLRVNGDLHYFGESLLEPEWLSDRLLALLTSEQQIQFQQQGQLDFALAIEGIRLRVNLFQQCDGISAAFRFIRNDIPPPKALGIPDSLIAMSNCLDGLVIVAGATGSGKSTTLAALISLINQQSDRHIITLEDPIEFIHHSNRCLIQQREVGRHVESFSQGLRAALRQDPDIILLGELRDAETIHMALTAAETGHLVFATLHTRSAVQSIERIIDVFPAEEKRFVSTQLANSLQAVVCQQLLPCTKGGRIAAYEVLVNTPAVSNMIREGKHHQLLTLLQTGAINGMQTMEQCKSRLLADGLIPGW